MTSVNAKQEALLDELLKDYTDPQDILGEHGLLKRLTKRVVERVLERALGLQDGEPHRAQPGCRPLPRWRAAHPAQCPCPHPPPRALRRATWPQDRPSAPQSGLDHVAPPPPPFVISWRRCPAHSCGP